MIHGFDDHPFTCSTTSTALGPYSSQLVLPTLFRDDLGTGMGLQMSDIPDINVNHIHFVKNNAVKFGYRITEEKHTNTTVKSSHDGKIESREY